MHDKSQGTWWSHGVNYFEYGRVRAPRGFTRIMAKWLAMIAGALSLSAGAWAVTIDIDEFQHDTVLLPFVPQPGTLFLCENSFVTLSPVTCEAPPSDTVVFLGSLTAGIALLESDLPEPGTPADPGDRMLLIPFPAPFFSIAEPGAEGTTQTLVYTPAVGQPGFAVVEGVPVSYTITSDAVPEPAAYLFIATGIVGLLGYNWRQKPPELAATSWVQEASRRKIVHWTLTHQVLSKPYLFGTLWACQNLQFLTRQTPVTSRSTVF